MDFRETLLGPVGNLKGHRQTSFYREEVGREKKERLLETLKVLGPLSRVWVL
jgi:hypothetical protein